jgi:3-deoxy-D-manno-octulosonic-acid transferase
VSGVIAPLLTGGWTITATLLAPALRLSLRHRAARGREIAARLDERFGCDATPRPPGKLLWMHAASVGETMSILPVLQALAPRASIVLTTGTVTSQSLLDARIPGLGLSGRVLPRFAPLDVPAWVNRFLSHWRPDAACFVESELWPNQLAACRARNIPVMLVNARMSDRSFRRWRQVPGLAQRLLDVFTEIHARGATDAERLRALGARRVESHGDLKSAAPPLPVDQAELDRLKTVFLDRPVWLAASTHPGEEDLIADCHRILAPRHPGLVTIMAPRHPGRGPALAQTLRAPRRSAGQPPPDTGLWIADTLGELGLWYRLAPISFVGRSLIPPGGGQNPLEPARLGCAIASGPYTANFADAVAELRRNGALAQVTGAPGLADFVNDMLADCGARRQMGERALACVRDHQALPVRTAQSLLSLLKLD